MFRDMFLSNSRSMFILRPTSWVPTQPTFYKCPTCSKMCSMKCTCADSGAGTGSDEVHTVQCAVCNVKCPAWNKQRVPL